MCVDLHWVARQKSAAGLTDSKNTGATRKAKPARRRMRSATGTIPSRSPGKAAIGTSAGDRRRSTKR